MSLSVGIGTAVPRPFYRRAWVPWAGQKSDATYIVGLDQEQLGGRQEDAISHRQDEASHYIELEKVRLQPSRIKAARTMGCLDRTIQFFQNKIPNCLQKSPAMVSRAQQTNLGNVEVK